jgi:membrane-associated phospholipid phosphatase
VSTFAARLDRGALRLLRTRLHGPVLERAMIVYAASGEFGALWIAVVLVGALRDRPRRGRWFGCAVLVPVALCLNYTVKVAVRRRRPRLRGLPALGRVPRTSSFPSAHAATSFAAAEAMGTLVPRRRARLRTAAALMAATRPYLGVHYPSDALGGALLGAVIGKGAGTMLRARAT